VEQVRILASERDNAQARALEPVIGLLLDAVTNSPMIGARNPFCALGY